ncbi:MAG TPA: serine/threonine-protein kinase [Candidatus Dormibacteraeota bacterium]
MSIETGTRLGQYEVQDLIGQGAMGVVYRAYHVQLARTGAVKLMHALTTDADTIARFRREAQAIAQMRHPNILNVFDFGEYQGTPYMIVEYVPGGSLASQLRQEPIDRASAMKYLRGIAAGLDYAHSLGIVHRDVKPANVLLEKDGTPVIADFGLVKLLQASSVRSMTGATTGTPAYMAPEQVTGSQIGPAADRYSLATIAYEMLTGAIPFEGEGLMEVLYAQVHREPPTPSARVPDLGPRVDAVIMRGLDKDPKARWESCEAFVTALGQALAGAAPPAVERTVVMAPPVAATRPLGHPAAAASTPNAGAVAARPKAGADAASMTVAIAAPAIEPRPSHRRRNAIAAAVLVLLLLLGVLGYAITRPSMSLSANRVHPGDLVLVNAKRLPANQIGEIQLLSQVYKFPFRSDANGNVTRQVEVPNDIEIGSHIVRVCWNGCRLQATLRVVGSGVSLASPTGNTMPTPSVGPSPTASTSPNPKSSPSPSARPSGGPGASPTSNPTPAPSPTPKLTPSPPPPPPPTPSPTITLVSISSTGNTTVTFHYYYGGSATITIHQGSTTKSVTRSVAPGSNTQVTFATPAGFLVTAPPLVPQAYVTVGSLTSNSVNVTL